MLKWKFWERAAPVTVDINELFDRLDLRKPGFRQDPRMHTAIQLHLNSYSLRGGSHWGPGMTFYQDPRRMIVVKAPDKQFRDEPDYDDEHFNSSACIAYTETARSGEKRSFALIIRSSADTLQGLAEAMVFGIEGVYDRDGQMSVKKLVVPGKDAANRMTPAKPIPITPQNVRGALYYAELCARSLYEGGPFHPRSCLEQSYHADLDTVGIKVKAPAP